MPLRPEQPSYPHPAEAVTPAPDEWLTPADLLALLGPRSPAPRRPWGDVPTPARAPALDCTSPPSTRTASAEE